MKKKCILLLLMLSAGLVVNAQHEYRVAKASGQLKVNLTNVTIEGYNGKEIVFQGEKTVVEETDERAKGLVSLSSSGYTDNTGLGVSVTESTNEVSVNLSSKKPIGRLTIKVPENIKISIMNYNDRLFLNTGNFTSKDEIVLKNLKNEIEVSVYSNKIKLENNTGPMNIKTVSGSIEASFNADIKGPVSIISVLDFVDVTLPLSTKANVELTSNMGKIYAAKEFQIDFEKQDQSLTSRLKSSNFLSVGGNKSATVITTTGGSTSEKTTEKTKGTGNVVKAEGTNVTVHSTTGSDPVFASSGAYTMNGFNHIYYGGGENIKGKINGGGLDLILKSNNKNVYLRYK